MIEGMAADWKIWLGRRGVSSFGESGRINSRRFASREGTDFLTNRGRIVLFSVRNERQHRLRGRRFREGSLPFRGMRRRGRRRRRCDHVHVLYLVRGGRCRSDRPGRGYLRALRRRSKCRVLSPNGRRLARRRNSSRFARLLRLLADLLPSFRVRAPLSRPRRVDVHRQDRFDFAAAAGVVRLVRWPVLARSGRRRRRRRTRRSGRHGRLALSRSLPAADVFRAPRTTGQLGNGLALQAFFELAQRGEVRLVAAAVIVVVVFMARRHWCLRSAGRRSGRRRSLTVCDAGRRLAGGRCTDCSGGRIVRVPVHGRGGRCHGLCRLTDRFCRRPRSLRSCGRVGVRDLVAAIASTFAESVHAGRLVEQGLGARFRRRGGSTSCAGHRLWLLARCSSEDGGRETDASKLLVLARALEALVGESVGADREGLPFVASKRTPACFTASWCGERVRASGHGADRRRFLRPQSSVLRAEAHRRVESVSNSRERTAIAEHEPLDTDKPGHGPAPLPCSPCSSSPPAAVRKLKSGTGSATSKERVRRPFDRSVADLRKPPCYRRCAAQPS